MIVLKVIFAFAQDPEVNCVHYGDNSEYESYGDCYDKEEGERNLREVSLKVGL